MDDVEARCQGAFGDVAFTFDDYSYDFNYSGHALRSRGESFLRPFAGTQMNLTDGQLWVDHPRTKTTAMPSTFKADDSVIYWAPDLWDEAAWDQAAASHELTPHDLRSKFQCGNHLCVKIFDPADDLQDPQWHAGELEYTMYVAYSRHPRSQALV